MSSNTNPVHAVYRVHLPKARDFNSAALTQLHTHHDCLFVFDKVNSATTPGFGCSHLKYRADSLNGTAPTPNDLTGILAGNPHFVHRETTPLDRSDGNRFRFIHQLLHDKLEEGLHGKSNSAQAATAASFADFLMKEATVSLG